MYFFFDTETSGLPKNWKAPITQLDNWPRVMQLGMQVFNSRRELVTKEKYYIQPPPGGFDISPDAFKTHGISNDLCEKEGIPLELAIQYFNGNLYRSNFLIAHNYAFDGSVWGCEFVRTNSKAIKNPPVICTMQATTEYCALPHSGKAAKYNNGSSFKWPKLAELHLKLFNEGFEEAHDALGDVTATARCFFECLDREVIIL